MFVLALNSSCWKKKRQCWENSCPPRESGWVAKFFSETVTTQGNYHYLVTQINYHLLLELGRPRAKQARASRPESPWLSLHSQRWQLEHSGHWGKVMHESLLPSLPWKRLGIECSHFLWIGPVLWAQGGKESTVLSQSVRIASGTGRCFQRE